jgi:hypothetical protein
MDSPNEKKEEINKKLLDDKECVNDPFFCANFVQYITNCCFLLCE